MSTGGTIALLDNTRCLRKAYMTPRLIEALLAHVHVMTLSTREDVRAFIDSPPANLIGIILSGGPLCISDHIGVELYSCNIQLMLHFPTVPVLGICFGFQVMGVVYGGVINRIPCEVNGLKPIQVSEGGVLCEGGYRGLVYANHCDQLVEPPPRFKVTMWGPDNSIEGIEMQGGACRVGVQFHPEGEKTTIFMIENFVRHCVQI
jgi:GMP synthase (glutamine-hydrolysing)